MNKTDYWNVFGAITGTLILFKIHFLFGIGLLPIVLGIIFSSISKSDIKKVKEWLKTNFKFLRPPTIGLI